MNRKLLIPILIMFLASTCFAPYPITYRVMGNPRLAARMLQDRIGTLDSDVADLQALSGGPFDNTGTAEIFYVDSGAAAGGAGTTWATAVDTLQEGIDLCTALRGDIVYVAQDHAEDITAASALDADCAGITIVGIGSGESQPTLSLITDAGADMTVSAADVCIYNIRILGARSGGVTAGMVITADGDGAQILGCQFRETTNDMEQLKMITAAANADELVIVGNRFINAPAGDGTSAIYLEGGSDKTIIQGNHFIGDWANDVIDGLQAVSTGITISDNFIMNLDTTAGKTIAVEATASGIISGNKCYGNGASFAIAGAAMFIAPDNIAMQTENVPTRNYETMFGPYRGDAAGTAGDSIYADMVLAQTDLDAIIADFTDYKLDKIVSAADGTTNAYPTSVASHSILAYLMSDDADPVTAHYDNTTMSLEALNVDLDAILLDTGTTLPSTLTGINTTIAALSDTGYVGTITSNTGNTSTFACTTLANFGNDYFNTGWSSVWILNISSVGTYEGETQDIVDYDSATGTFTLNTAASEQMTTGDGVYIRRVEELNPDDETMLGCAGTIRYVDSGTSGDGSGLTLENAYATIALAEAACAAGDVVYIADGHDEEIGDIVINNAANISFIGMGEGDARPLLTCNDSTDEITIDEAGITMKNLRLQAGADQVVTAFRVEDVGTGCTLENISFIEGEGANEEFVICIDVDDTAWNLTVKDCTYSNDAATSTHTSCFIDLTDGAIEDVTITGCNVFGEFANGGIYSNKTCKNLNIIDNVISNTTTTKYAIQLSAACTGSLVNNRLYSDSYGTMLDPGSLKCSGNLGVDAIDQQAIAIPLSAETSDVGEVAAGSNLERLEWLQKQADDIIAVLGVDSALDNVWYVDKSAAGAADGTSWLDAEVTLAAAINDATNNGGAYIFVAVEHTENLGTVAVDVPGLTIIGLGVGEARPIFTHDTATDVMAHTVANVKYKNLIFTVSTQDCTAGVTLDGSSDGAVFEDCEWRGDGAGLEFVSTVTFSAAACNNVRFTRCKFDNYGGANATAAITNIVGAQVNLTIEDCQFVGAWTSAAIHSTQIDLNLTVRDNLVQNTSTGIHAIEITQATSTGNLLNNMCYGDTYGTVIDPGGLRCYGNRVTSAVDQSGSVYPAVPQQIDRIHGTGQVFYVDASGSNGDGRTPATAKTTLDAAIGLCTSNRGDFIYVMQGHAETIGAATAFTLDIAGISIIGLGNGDNRPIFNMNNAAATIVTTNAGDNILIENIKFLAQVDSVALCLDIVDGTDNVTIRNCVFEAETDGTDEFDESILVGNACIGTTIDGCVFDMANGEAVAAIGSDNDTDHTTIKNCTIMGDYSTACIEFSTVASTDFHILDNILINGDLVADNGLNSEPCLEIVDATGGFVKGNYFASDMAGNHLAMTVADDMCFMQNFSTDDDGDDFEGSDRSATTAVTVSNDG